MKIKSKWPLIIGLILLSIVFFSKFWELSEHYVEYRTFLLAITNIALVGVTAAYVWITYRTLSELKETRLAEYQPIIHIDLYNDVDAGKLDANKQLANITVRNLGRGLALHAGMVWIHKIKVPDSPSELKGARQFLKIPKGVLQPNDELVFNIEIPILGTPSKNVIKDFLRLEITYEDALRNLYFLQQKYDLSIVMQSIILTSEGLWIIPTNYRFIEDRSFLADIDHVGKLVYKRKKIYRY